MSRVVSLCSILLDLAVDVPHVPEPGGDVLAGQARLEVGGGLNLLAAVARQGTPVVYGGIAGTGPYGDRVRDALDALGVEVLHPPADDGDTGLCVAMVDPSAERTFITSPGAESRLQPEHVRDLGRGADHLVVLSGYDLVYPVSGGTLTEWALTLDGEARLVLDPGPLVADLTPHTWRALVPHLGVLTLNEREARALAGSPEHDAVRSHLGLVPSTVLVVRRGELGCTADGGAAEGRDPVVVRAPRVAAVDSTGAGDAHTGVLVAELAGGSALVPALVRANAAGAVTVTRRGPATAPTRAEIDALLAG